MLKNNLIQAKEKLVQLLNRSGCPYKDVRQRKNGLVIVLSSYGWAGFPKQVDQFYVDIEHELD